VRTNPFNRTLKVPRGFTTSPLYFLSKENEYDEGDMEVLKAKVDPDSTGRAVAGAGLFHVTTNLPAVLADGRLRSRRELQDAGVESAGLGGAGDWDAGAVSVGVLRDGALRVLKAVQLMADAVHGRIDGARALTAMNEVLEPTMRVANHYAKLRQSSAEREQYLKLVSGTQTTAELIEEQHKAAQAVRKAKPGVDLYEALRNYESIAGYRYQLGDADNNWNMDIGACAQPVTFVEPAHKFARVNPDNIGLLQLAARKTAEPEAISNECELQFKPEDLVIVGVWKASQKRAGGNRAAV
jgi:hypothetical protein